MRLIKSIVLLLFIAAVILFAFQNMELIKLSFLNWHLEIPLSFASILLYVLGAISGGIVLSMLKKLSLEDSDKKKN
jgi:putative membrane protein